MVSASTQALARRFRAQPTASEAKLWSLLRGRQVAGLKSRRQARIGGYVADFVCLRHRLIIEADGPQHDPAADAVRDAWLRDQQFRILRFPNSRITLYPELVLDEIRAAAGIQPYPSSGPSGHLLPQGEKETRA